MTRTRRLGNFPKQSALFKPLLTYIAQNGKQMPLAGGGSAVAIRISLLRADMTSVLGAQLGVSADAQRIMNKGGKDFAWWGYIRDAVSTCRQEGWMYNGLIRGVWAITPEGRKWMSEQLPLPLPPAPAMVPVMAPAPVAGAPQHNGKAASDIVVAVAALAGVQDVLQSASHEQRIAVLALYCDTECIEIQEIERASI